VRGAGPALGGGPAPMAATPSVARQDHAPEVTGFAREWPPRGHADRLRAGACRPPGPNGSFW